jgi:pimeloyl-ACP methyl ester carboxylesterase
MLLGSGAGVAALSSCSDGSEGGQATPVAPSDNGYVAAPPLPRMFTPPAALDLSAEGQVELPMAGGAALYYWDTGGDGDAIVMAHAATGSAYVWGYQQQTFAEAGYRVIAYSRRGYRGSDTGPVDESNQSLDGSGRPLDDIHALVTHLALDRFHLLGHAAGGGIANGYIKEHPNRILTSISVAALQSIADEDWAVPMNSIRAPGSGDELGSFNSNPPELREVGPSYRWANPEGLAAWIALEHENRPVNVTHAPGVEVTWTDIESRTFPTLLIAGDADLYAPPSMYRYLSSRVPASELYIVSEAGHSVYWEQPDTFNALVLDFLERHSG